MTMTFCIKSFVNLVDFIILSLLTSVLALCKSSRPFLWNMNSSTHPLITVIFYFYNICLIIQKINIFKYISLKVHFTLFQSSSYFDLPTVLFAFQPTILNVFTSPFAWTLTPIFKSFL